MTRETIMKEYGMHLVCDGERIILPVTRPEMLDGVLIRDPVMDERYRKYMANVKPMDEDWKERNRSRWWGRPERESGIDPLLYDLRDRLISFGGESVCMTFGEPDVKEILQFGQLWADPNPVIIRGEECRCHENALRLMRFSNGARRLCTGYALSDDGMWRQHSWCIEKRPRTVRIVETTEERVMYFGYVLSDKDVRRFEERL